MRRLGLILLCLFVAAAVGGTTVASAHGHGHRHKACRDHKKSHKRGHKRRCRARRNAGRKQHNAGRKHHNAGKKSQSGGKVKQDISQASSEAPRELPPLADLIAPETACPGQSDESLSVESQEATMACMINYARSAAGESGLADVPLLNDSSDGKATDIIQCNQFSHEACGREFTYWLEQDGYAQRGGCWGAGENLAWGTGELGTVRSILTAWVNSPDHLENMLDGEFEQFGVGLEVGTLNGYPEAHVWVTHFGTVC